MANRFLLATLICICAGCAGVSAPTDDRVVPVVRPDGSADASTHETPPTPASNNLLRQAEQQLQLKNYQSAIATAERGLRINRRVAAYYWVIARSYQQLDKPELAQQFAQQGLRYLKTSESDLKQKLNDIINRP